MVHNFFNALPFGPHGPSGNTFAAFYFSLTRPLYFSKSVFVFFQTFLYLFVNRKIGQRKTLSDQ
jgi:hypothetical protein